MQSRLARPDRNSAMAAADELALKKVWLSGSPPRRRTRSQSREAEMRLGTQSGDGTRMQKGSKQTGNGLAAVAEESPVSSNSPKKPGNSPQKASARPNRPSLDWQDDSANISGTTIFPPESESDVELDPLVMIDALPDLDKAASDLLNFVVRNEQDPVRAVNTAKQLANPQNRMFKRRRDNLLREAENFGNQTYIDVNLVNRSIMSAVQDKVAAEPTRSPDLILHRANCALLALEVLVAGFANSPEDAINVLEGNFPARFLGTQLEASLEAATFDLALEVRTQYLVAQLEMHQNDDDFNPVAVLESVFYDEIMPDEEFTESDLRPLRGFAFGPFEDENGRFPERFKNAANDRINDVRALADEEDGSHIVAALRGAYRWQWFKRRTVEWIRSRDDAITQELKRQRDTEDIGKESPGESGHHASFDGATASPFTGGGSTVRTHTPTAPSGRATPSDQAASSSRAGAAHTGGTAPRDRAAAGTPEGSENRRKSVKGPFLNPSAMKRMAERQQAASAAEGHESDAAGWQHATSENPRRQTLAAPESRDVTEWEASTQRSPMQEPRRQTLGAFAESTRAAAAEWEMPGSSRRSPAQDTRREDTPEEIPASTGSSPDPQSDGEQFDEEFHIPSTEEILDTANQGAKGKALRPGPFRTASTPIPAVAQRQMLFIDRQPDADKVSPISQGDAQSAETSRTRQPPKRARDPFEDSDEEFTQDDRPVDVAEKRAQKPDQLPNKRRRTLRTARSPASEETTYRDPSPPPRHQPQPMDEEILSRERLPSISELDTEPKLRRRWTKEADEQLIMYMEKYGTSWAHIKAADNARPEASGGNMFKDRDQVQLKDRARNLKFRLIREGQPMPKNFDRVSLSKKQRDQLGMD